MRAGSIWPARSRLTTAEIHGATPPPQPCTQVEAQAEAAVVGLVALWPLAARLRPVPPWRLASRGSSVSDLAIRIEDVSHDFDGVRALDRLSLQVPKGSVFGFLGPNGSGKTTPSTVLLGLLTPTSGRAEVLGFDTAREGESVRERCGALLEDAGTYDNLTVAENLEFYGRLWIDA